MRGHILRFIFNALQATPPGGKLTVNDTAVNSAVTIYISDIVVGIPYAMRGKLFSPLTTGKAKGTRLGLATVKWIVDAHNGAITLSGGDVYGDTSALRLTRCIDRCWYLLWDAQVFITQPLLAKRVFLYVLERGGHYSTANIR